jgi:hypothetical protein
MSETVQTEFNPVVATASLSLDKARVSQLLLSMGVDLSGTLSSSIILGSLDVMIAAEIANCLPGDANFPATLNCLHTLHVQQPEPVREVQTRVLDLVRKVCMPMTDDRYKAIRQRLVPSAA